MAGVVKEPSYEEFNKYPEKTQYYGDELKNHIITQELLLEKQVFINLKFQHL